VAGDLETSGVTSAHGPASVPEPIGFDSFYQSEYRSLLVLVHGICGSRWSAEEIVQETFLRASQDWDRVRAMRSPVGWIRRVALNLARTRLRRLKAEAKARARLGAPHFTVDAMPVEVEAFWSEVRRLPARQRQVIALRYVEDMSVAEIADTLEIAHGTVRALLFQGRSRLEDRLVSKGWLDATS
jgi:RNA polymerase sigma-70 factor (ECF subfamily)